VRPWSASRPRSSMPRASSASLTVAPSITGRDRATQGLVGHGSFSFAKQSVAKSGRNGHRSVESAHPALPAGGAVIHMDSKEGLPRRFGGRHGAAFSLRSQGTFRQQKEDVLGRELLAGLGGNLQPHLLQQLVLDEGQLRQCPSHGRSRAVRRFMSSFSTAKWAALAKPRS